VSTLSGERCVACRRDSPRVTEAETAVLRREVPDWQPLERDGIARLERVFLFTAVGMDDARLQAYEPAPSRPAYTAFMAWLALYGSEAEVAAGSLVNFPACGANCGRMSRALRDRHGLTEKATAFFDLFATPPSEFEGQAMAVVADGLARGADRRRVKRAARLLQGYEKLYWDTLHGLSK
jgi:hypothetical protein